MNGFVLNISSHINLSLRSTRGMVPHVQGIITKGRVYGMGVSIGNSRYLFLLVVRMLLLDRSRGRGSQQPISISSHI